FIPLCSIPFGRCPRARFQGLKFYSLCSIPFGALPSGEAGSLRLDKANFKLQTSNFLNGFPRFVKQCLFWTVRRNFPEWFNRLPRLIHFFGQLLIQLRSLGLPCDH